MCSVNLQASLLSSKVKVSLVCLCVCSLFLWLVLFFVHLQCIINLSCCCQGPFSKFNRCRKSRNVMWEEARLHQLTRAVRKKKRKVNCLGSFVIANRFFGFLYKVKFVANKKIWHLHVFQQHQSLCKHTPPPSWSRNSRVIVLDSAHMRGEPPTSLTVLNFPGGAYRIWRVLWRSHCCRLDPLSAILNIGRCKTGSLRQGLTELLSARNTLVNRRKFVLWMQEGILKRQMMCKSCDTPMTAVQVSRQDGFHW